VTTQDENDKLRAGKLSPDPLADAARLRVVKPNEKPKTTEPADLAAEDALLGALLWAGTNAPGMLRVRAVLDLLETGEPFYIRKNGDTYDAIVAVAAAGAEHDPVAVNAELVKQQRATGLDFLRGLLNEASTISERQARVYAESIRDAWARRKVIAEARVLIEDAKGTKVATADLVAAAQLVATQAANRSAQRSGFVWIRQSAESLFLKLTAGQNVAFSTGLRDLDEAMNGGVRPKETSIVAARTSVGKSLLATQISEFMVTSRDDVGVLYVVMEMQNEAMTSRILGARAGIPLSNLRRMVLNPTQWTNLTGAVTEAAPKRLAFADSKTQTLSSVYSMARSVSMALNREGKRLAMVVIDHIGLIKPSAEVLKRGTREQQVAETSRGLAYIGAELNCHVMGLVQIHRDAERQANTQMPKLHHLRESGAIENDADSILILHRPRDQKSGVFDNSKPPALALAKGRLDDTAIMLLEFQRERARFVDYNGTETFTQVYGK
jgi:replicative DNA helicase